MFQENARLKQQNAVLRMSLEDMKLMHRNQHQIQSKEWEKTLQAMYQKRKQTITQHSLYLQSISLKLKSCISELRELRSVDDSNDDSDSVSPETENDELSVPLIQLIDCQFKRMNQGLCNLKRFYIDQQRKSSKKLQSLKCQMLNMKQREALCLLSVYYRGF